MRYLTLCLALLMPLAALATPPRVISMTDRLVGQSEDAIFVERVVSDNLGYHYSALTDVFLVKIPLDGSPVSLMPIRTVHQDFNRAYENGTAIELDELFAGRTDVHGGLISAGAAPISERTFEREDITITEGQSSVTVKFGSDDPSWHLSPRTAAQAQWDHTRAALPVTRPFDVEEDVESEFYTDRCRIDKIREIWMAQQQTQAFAAVICDEESETQYIRVWLRLDPA